MPQSGEDLDPGRALLGHDQRPDHIPQGVAAVEDAQMGPLDDPGLLPEQSHGQLALGAEALGLPGGLGAFGELRLAEVEPTGDGRVGAP